MQLTALPSARNWVVLTLEAEHSSLAREDAAAQSLTWGYHSIAQRCLRHQPVNDADVETAIAEIEDLIMPLSRPWPVPTATLTLACTATPWATLQTYLDASNDTLPDWQLYDTSVVEDLFNRFADTVMGGPARGLLLSHDEVACLTITRECLHHWGMQTLALPHPIAG